MIAPALMTWGPGPVWADQFAHPYYVAADGGGNIYVTEPEQHRVQKFDATGAFVTKWGTFGSGDGQFNMPEGIAVDTTGNVYVADYRNSRIQKFTTAGVFLSKWTVPGLAATPPQRAVALAVDGSGKVYVTASEARRVQVFSGAGAPLVTWGGGLPGAGNGRFSQNQPPGGIAVDPAGFVYVSDTGNHRVQKFDASGTFLGWAGGCSSGTGCDVPNQRSLGFQCTATTCSVPGSGSGSGDGQFLLPAGITVDPAGNLYVADSSNHRIQVFDANGFKAKWGSNGVASGEFRQPKGVAAAGGSVYVADTGNNRVQKFDSNGVAQMVWGADVTLAASPGAAPGFADTIMLAPSSSRQSVITVQSLNQFSGPVSLSVFCCIDFDSSGGVKPAGVSVQLASSQVTVPANGFATALLGISVSSAPQEGKFIARVSATNPALGINRELSVVFTVGADLSVSAPLNGALFPPASLPATVTVASLKRFVGHVSLSTSCCFDVLTQTETPLGGVSASVSPPEVDLRADGSATADLTVTGSVAPPFGKYLVHVKAKHATGTIEREARPAFTVLPTSEVAPACAPTVAVMPLKAALVSLIAAKETAFPPGGLKVGIVQGVDGLLWTIEEDPTLLPTEANIVLKNPTGHEKAIVTTGCSSAPKIAVSTGPDATMKINAADSTLVFKKLVCTSSFIVCLSTTWVDVAVFPTPGFWRVFGGRKSTFLWKFDH